LTDNNAHTEIAFISKEEREKMKRLKRRKKKKR